MKEEITKEIKNINELSDNETYTENKEESTVVKEIPKKEPKPNKKIIIGIIVSVVIVLGIILCIILFGKNKTTQTPTTKKSVYSSFVTAIKKSLETGTFDAEIKKGLKEYSLVTDKVYLLAMDIDSDNKLELVVYAEDDNNKVILQIEVDDEPHYDDSYQLDEKESLALIYSIESKKTFWYTKYNNGNTIISSAKKIYKDTEFVDKYYQISNVYKNTPILANNIEYTFSDDLDAENLEQNAITVEELLKDNNINKEDLDSLAKEYFAEREVEQRKLEEEKEKARLAEEEAKKTEGTLRLGNLYYKYGKYNIYASDGTLTGTFVIYTDLTCSYKGISCTYEVEKKIKVSENDDQGLPGIIVSTGQTYIITDKDVELIDLNETETLVYDN